MVGVSVFLAGFAATFGAALAAAFGAAFGVAFTAAFAGLPADVAVGLVVGFAAGFGVGLVAARVGFATTLTDFPADLADVVVFSAGAAFFGAAFAPVFDGLAEAEPDTFFAGTGLFAPAAFAGAFFEDLAGIEAFFVATGLACFAAGFDGAGFFAAGFVFLTAGFFVFFAAIIVFGFRDSEKKIEITCL